MIFQTSSQIEKISTRADNTISLTVGTQELKPEEAAILFTLKGKQGWMLFSENALNEKDIPKETAPEFKGDKSPTQRLRAVVYRYWEKNTNKSKSFDTFWKEWVESKIEAVKETLN